jgi:FkbH-like protein
MLLAKNNSFVTRQRLVTHSWSWGPLHEPPITTTLFFGEDGLIKNYSHENEHSWLLEDGILHIFNRSGALFWLFEIMFLAHDRLTLISRFQNNAPWQPFFCLSENPTSEAVPAATAMSSEAIRLVIWDLDDTFWEGTLSEGPVTPVLEHISLVRTLNERGIINSICSKNDFAAVKTLLENLGLWDEFVFPEIAFAPKGEAIVRIVENVQLRPETVLFIDDNPVNLNEALYYNPKLNVADPSIIPAMLSDARFAGKPDVQKTRLARYKVLEQKASEKVAAKGDNLQFLRDSKIRISFHDDIEAEFPRIHDLVNRTNQLNFTKNRWPEDIEAARAVYHEEQHRNFVSYGAYVKVSDRYGDYGICGFYFVIMDVCQHFLFSCRSMNMGVEQFVWNRLRRPQINIQGEVISDLNMDVDWITVAADADADDGKASEADNLTICIRGACDMWMISNFLRTRANTIEELTYAWEGWEICSLPRIVALHDELQSPANQEIIKRLPGMPPNRFATDVIDGRSDAYVLSFSQESFHGLYRSRSTGMILPMGHFSIGHMQAVKTDYTSVPYSDIETYGTIGISAAQWQFFQQEFEFVGGFSEAIFTADIEKVFAILAAHRKPVIIIGLNHSVGTDTSILEFFGIINRIVQPRAAHFGFHYLDSRDFVRGHDDLAPDGMFGGPHYARKVYAALADAILGYLGWGTK